MNKQLIEKYLGEGKLNEKDPSPQSRLYADLEGDLDDFMVNFRVALTDGSMKKAQAQVKKLVKIAHEVGKDLHRATDLK